MIQYLHKKLPFYTDNLTRRIYMQMSTNEYVWVELTEEGKLVLAEYRQRMLSATKGMVDEKFEERHGWTCFQMHELMYIFGHRSSVGQKQLFKKNIISTQPLV
jgi:hypothetical protein